MYDLEFLAFVIYDSTFPQSTVLLNANVAFLAIQSVDEDNQGGNSPIRLPLYLSMLSSLASVLFSLLLLQPTKDDTSLSYIHIVSILDGETAVR